MGSGRKVNLTADVLDNGDIIKFTHSHRQANQMIFERVVWFEWWELISRKPRRAAATAR